MKTLFDSINTMEAALTFHRDRQAVLAGNIANLDTPGYKPQDEFKGITIDIGVPAVHAWAAAEVDRVVSDYHLDMLEHDGYVVAQGCERADHPHAPPDAQSTRRFEDSGFLWVDSANSTDVSYHATRAYYDIYSNLRRQHPNLLLEICNDGGRMVVNDSGPVSVVPCDRL